MKRKNINILNNEPIPRQQAPKKYCGFCKTGVSYMDCMNASFLKNFVNAQGKILPPLYTGNCKKHQNRVANAIKRARIIAVLPTVADNLI